MYIYRSSHIINIEICHFVVWDDVLCTFIEGHTSYLIPCFHILFHIMGVTAG